VPTPPRKSQPPQRRTNAPGTRDTVRPKRVARPPVRRSFVQRNQTKIVVAAVAVALLGLGVLAFLNATSPAYACATEWTAPSSTPAPAPSATPRLGFQQDDMGRTHVDPPTFIRYLTCPPASGKHYNAAGLGPITAKVYGPDENTIPQGWIHNLEHGGLVLLYKCPGDACTETGQADLRQLYQSFPSSPICNLPPGAIGPVITRFDQMEYPYAALVWDQVLPLQTLDKQQVITFFNQQAERFNPEKQPQCGASPGPSIGATAAPTAAPTVAPSLPPSTTAPSSSPTAS
jgi:hypothetical protein